MDAPFLKVHLQRAKSDCGIAVLAMLLGKSYEEVLLAAAGVAPKVLTRGVYWEQVKQIAKKLGYKYKIKKARNVSLTDVVGALSVESPEWDNDHLVVIKEGLIVDTDGTLWDHDVYFKINKAKATSLMVFEPK